MTTDVTQSSKWLATQYKGTNIDGLTNDLSQIEQTYLIDTMNMFVPLFNIDTAYGVWLDYVGFRYGINSRPSFPDTVEGGDATLPFSDDDFRQFIKAVSLKLTSNTNASPDNTREGLLEFFDTAIVYDNFNMTMSVYVTSSKSLPIMISAFNSDIMIRASGVRYFVDIIPVSDEVFGMDGNGLGFDQSPFVYSFSI